MKTRSVGEKLPGEVGGYQFGSYASNYEGWLIPANTSLSTTYNTNRTLGDYIQATFNVFPYDITPSTTLQIGIYVNDELAGSQSYNLGAYKLPKVDLESLKPATEGDELATFSPSVLSIIAAATLKSNVASGANVTLTVIASSPIWSQISQGSAAKTVEGKVGLSITLSEALNPADFNSAPNTLCFEVSSSG